MKRILIVTGGSIDFAFGKQFLSEHPFDRVIVVDGALAYMDKLGLIPDLIVGDFDTVDHALFDRYADVPRETHQPEKDDTDTQLALFRALETEGVSEIAILGALGRRFDHALGNLQILKLALSAGVSCSLYDPYNRIRLLDHDTVFEKKKLYGKYVSFIPLTERAEGITLEGFKYPLQNAVFTQGNSLGISNELVEETGFLKMTKGILICIESGDKAV